MRNKNRVAAFVYNIDVAPLIYSYAASCHTVGIRPDMIQCRTRIMNDGGI